MPLGRESADSGDPVGRAWTAGSVTLSVAARSKTPSPAAVSMRTFRPSRAIDSTRSRRRVGSQDARNKPEAALPRDEKHREGEEQLGEEQPAVARTHQSRQTADQEARVHEAGAEQDPDTGQGEPGEPVQPSRRPPPRRGASRRGMRP